MCLRLVKQIIGILFCIVMPQSSVFGQEWGDIQLSYIREVGNLLYLSDFQLGSDEVIADQEGHGLSIGWFIKNTGKEFFLFNIGYSETAYIGNVEDGVDVSFQPRAGTGFGALSESKNIIYEIDLRFENPFISFSYTNWDIVSFGVHASHIPWPSTYGFGVIIQSVAGEIVIRGIDQTQIAQADYDSGLRRFALLGWDFNFEFMYVSLIFRHVESPVLNVKNCNSDAIGELACDRMLAGTGNRNAATSIFTGGVLAVGILF